MAASRRKGGGAGTPPNANMSRKRRCYEPGHRPKYLVVIDKTAECDRAVYYASRRAARTGAGVLMLRVIETGDRAPQWLGVAEIMQAEQHEEAGEMVARFAARANGIAGITPERVIREGDPTEEILALIEEDEDIAVLVLAAGDDEEPGPLVTSLSQAAGSFLIPMTIVPGHLSDDELDAMT